MNKTVRDILVLEFHAAKRTLEDTKQRLELAVDHRANKEAQLKLAQRNEADDALICQKAADRLKDLTDFLVENGEGGMTVL